jgi:transposase
VLDVKLPFARTGRVWPYYGDKDHPVILYAYTPTRERNGPEKFLEGYRGYLQADAYGGYDAFFKDPARGLIEVGCWSHVRRYYHKALDSDQARMGTALLLIAQLYKVEKKARLFTAEDRLRLRRAESRPILDKLHGSLQEIEAEVLPKSPEGRAVRYTLKNWTALNRYFEDGDLEIDNNHTKRAIRGVAVGRSNWVFFGNDYGGKTAAVLGASWHLASGSESIPSLGSRGALAHRLPPNQEIKLTRPSAGFCKGLIHRNPTGAGGL